MKKEVGTVCVSTTPISLYSEYVGYPKATVYTWYLLTGGQVPYFSYYYDELLAIVVRSTVLYCTS